MSRLSPLCVLSRAPNEYIDSSLSIRLALPFYRFVVGDTYIRFTWNRRRAILAQLLHAKRETVRIPSRFRFRCDFYKFRILRREIEIDR